MDLNQVIFSGRVGWFKDKQAGANFGSISLRVHLPHFRYSTHDGQEVDIDNPLVWVSVKTQYESGVMDRKSKALMDGLKDNPYVFIRNSKITNWKRIPKENGKPIPGAPEKLEFSVDAYPGSISFQDSEFAVFNTCMFSGTVKDLSSDGRMKLSCSYRNVKDNKYLERYIPVLYTGRYEPALLNSKVMIAGRICGTRPDGSNGPYIITDSIART